MSTIAVIGEERPMLATAPMLSSWDLDEAVVRDQM